ncbi:unnamed protein product [Candidula unifasciata]|uniref:Uncharacterized protein n=1 Tax=Candidula unifasciata TaxID=100452 RepID=A0A8S3ZXP9_9EUPU|nr:unnamed protein product [Candidula unifasciata]
MNTLQASIFAALISLLLVTPSSTAAVSESASSRTKRQSADVRTAEYLAWIALGGKVPSQGCELVACGVVDVHASGKKKRDPQYAPISDEERYSLLKSLIQRAAENTLS